MKLLKVSEQGKSEEWLLFSNGKTWSTTSQSLTYLEGDGQRHGWPLTTPRRAEHRGGGRSRSKRGQEEVGMAEGQPPAAECTGGHQIPEHQTETASLCEETLGPEAEGTQAGPSATYEPCDPGHTLRLSNHNLGCKGRK